MANARHTGAATGPADTLNAFMAIGDSITMGYPALLGGWRAKLSALMPGIVWQGRNDNTGLHEGYNGFRADQDLTTVQPCLRPLQPRALLITLGVNDINQGETPAATLAEVIALAQTFAAESTYINHVFISEIPIGSTMNADGASAFNSGLAAAVAAIGDPKFIAASTCSRLVIATDFADGLHPNEGGYQKMAEDWYAVLHPLYPTL